MIHLEKCCYLATATQSQNCVSDDISSWNFVFVLFVLHTLKKSLFLTNSENDVLCWKYSNRIPSSLI